MRRVWCRRTLPDSLADQIEHDVSAANDGFIRNAQNAVAVFSQPAVANGVMLPPCLAVMWRTVKFHDQAMSDAKKIDDVTADRRLAAEFQAIELRAAQRAPKNGLGLGRLSP
jgi:hypothetical protein